MMQRPWRMMRTSLPLSESLDSRRFWWQHLNGYHWFVLILCALGWMFDCADQMIFTISRSITMRDLLPGATPNAQTQAGAWATTLFMLGWATGGLFFGIVGDKWGRAKTMALTVFLYGICTGLSALARNVTQFEIARMITGFGVGGEFAAGAALVADVMPQAARAQALGLLQALSAFGNILGAQMLGWSSAIAHRIYEHRAHGGVHLPYSEQHLTWTYLYWAGAFPALVAVGFMWRMKEPQKWVEAKASAIASGAQRDFGRLADLFTDARWRRNALVGLALAISGVVALWSIGFYSPELIDASIPQMSARTGHAIEQAIATTDDAERARLVMRFDAADQKAYVSALTNTALRGDKTPTTLTGLAGVHLSPARRQRLQDRLAMRMEPREADHLKSTAITFQQFGAFLGMLTFGFLATRIGRRWSFVISFLCAWASIYIVFLGFHRPGQIWYLYPLLGFCTLLPFGGYAIYFPELFPTRLRTTGTGFCYNVGRYVSSMGPLVFGGLIALLAGRFDTPAFRVAAVIVASIYVLGIIAALLGPETMNQPLPEDQRGVAH